MMTTRLPAAEISFSGASNSPCCTRFPHGSTPSPGTPRRTRGPGTGVPRRFAPPASATGVELLQVADGDCCPPDVGVVWNRVPSPSNTARRGGRGGASPS